MRIVVLIDDRTVIERILRHLGLWEQFARVFLSKGTSGTGRMGHWTLPG